MASSSNNATTGAPEFADSDAPDVAVNVTEVAVFAAQVGTRLIGDDTDMAAYAYARDGLRWFNTTDGLEYRHDGTNWVREQVRAHGSVACAGTGAGSAPVYYSDLIDVTFPVGLFTSAPRVFVQTVGDAAQVPFGGLVEQITTSGCKVRGMRIGSIPSATFSVQWFAVQG